VMDRGTLMTALLGITAGVAWFVFYFKNIYKSDFTILPTEWDHMTSVEEAEKAKAEAIHEPPGTPRTTDVEPDLILVFHHPDFDYPDKDEEATDKMLDKVILHTVKSNEAKLSADPNMHLQTMNHRHLIQKQNKKNAPSERATPKSPRTREEEAPDEQTGPLKMRSTRTALLTDMYHCLHAWGFEVAIFSSVDDDELFLCVSLSDENMIQKFMMQNHVKLQIRKSVIKKMGIEQDPKVCESSPPYTRYDPKLVRNLHTAGILEANDPSLLYHLTDRPAKGQKPKLANSLERARIIFSEIQHHLDLDAAKESGLLVDWYPTHDYNWVGEFRKTFSNWGLLLDLTFLQPVNMLYQYFGSRVAFNQAWNGFYAKALLALLVIALVTETGVFFTQNIYNLSKAEVNTMLKKQILAFSIITIIWSKIAANRWLREEEFGVKLWEVHSKKPGLRPQFIGDLLPSPANANITEKQYPAWKSSLRWNTSMLITLIFCSVVFAIVNLWMSIFKGKLTLTANILLAIQIKIFEIIWNKLSPLLTDFENHRYQDTYYNSLLWKQFTFQAVNNYSFFLYIAVKQRFSDEGCPEGGCLEFLRVQLSITLAILAACRIVQVIAESLIVKFTLAWELHQLKKAQGPEAEPPNRSVEEEQSKYGAFRVREQIVNMLQLVLGLGYVTLFAAIAPIVVPFCFVVFVVSLRAQAYSLTDTLQRPVPRVAMGIGAWRDVVRVIMNAGVVFNAFQLVVYGEDFQGAHVLARLTAGTLFVMMMHLIWALIDVFEPSSGGSSSQASVLDARRSCVEETLRVKSDLHKGSDEIRADQLGKRSTLVADAIVKGLWSHIPHLHETPPGSIQSPRSDHGPR